MTMQGIKKLVISNEMLKFEWDYEPESNFNIPACSFLWNMEWFGSQEDENNKFDILKEFKKEEKGYTYIVQNYIDNKPLFKYKVKVVLEGDNYKINSIQRQ